MPCFVNAARIVFIFTAGMPVNDKIRGHQMRTGKHRKRILLRTYNAIVLLILVIAASSDAQIREQDAPEYNNELSI
jgi:hypothetical protein